MKKVIVAAAAAAALVALGAQAQDSPPPPAAPKEEEKAVMLTPTDAKLAIALLELVVKEKGFEHAKQAIYIADKLFAPFAKSQPAP